MIWEIDDQKPQIEGLDAEGRADPAYAASLGLVPARRGMRVLAALTEWVLGALLVLPGVLIAVGPLGEVASGGVSMADFFARDDLVLIIVMMSISSALVNIFIVVQLILHGRKGVTLGKGIFGIRSVNVRTLERPKFWRGAVVRYLILYASFVVPLFGPVLVIALSPLFDPERRGRGWLDLVAGTWFVDVRRGLNPYDQKRMRIARKKLKTPEHEGMQELVSLATPVDRNARAEYTPSARFSGGVLGAHRADAPAASAPAAAGDAQDVVSAVPPSLATGAPGQPQAFTPPPAPAATPAQAAAATPVPSFAPPAAPTPVSSYAPPAAPATPSAAVSAVTASPPPNPHPPTDRPVPAAAQPPAAAAATATDGIRAVLVLDSGDRFEVRGTTLFGRSPSAAPGEAGAQLARIHDDTRSVSKTHLAIVPARRGVFALDRGSTNGSAILRAGGEIALVPGQPTELQAGDAVRFGDRILQVERI